MLKKLKDNSGFTLVEIIVVMVIISIVGIGIVEMMMATQKAQSTVEKRIEEQQVSADIISSIRVNLANVSNLKVVDSSEITVDDPDDEYSYLIYDSVIGGLTVNEYDSTTGSRTVSYIRKDSNSEYGSRISFKQEANYLQVTVSVLEKDDTGSLTSNILYEESTKIAMDSNVLESLSGSGNQQPAVRFKRIT